MHSFSNRLKELRQKTGVKQKELADLLNVSIRAIGYYETGEREPNIQGLVSLAIFFNVSLDYLTGRTDDPTFVPKLAIPKKEPLNLWPEDPNKWSKLKRMKEVAELVGQLMVEDIKKLKDK